MPTTRISPEGLELLRDLSRSLKQPHTTVLDQALETLRRQLFFEQMNQQFARLKADPTAWEEEMAERRLWDGAAGDAAKE